MRPQPKVTLLIVTYNQRSLVEEAFESALAQDYPNLEIIFSDDCSTDETFEAIEAAARNRLDQHNVIVRTTTKNLGLVPHIFEAARCATGELIVVGAGDDLSYPHRVSRLVEVWKASEADALSSGWDVIDENGRLLKASCHGGRSDLHFDEYFPSLPFCQIIGATAAYTSEVFSRIAPPSDTVFAEDLYLSLMLASRGCKVVSVDEPLVAYRQHGGALTHTGASDSGVVAHEHSVAKESLRLATLLEVFLADVDGNREHGAVQHQLARAAVRDDIDYNRYRSMWLEYDLSKRLWALGHFRDSRRLRWLVPRVFGLNGLVRAKRVSEMMSKTVRTLRGRP